MNAASLALVVHVVGTAFMCGLDWLVQVVHYPLFPFVTPAHWPDFHAEHSRRISWVVGPPWAMQGVGGVVLLAERPRDVGLGLVLAALVLAGVTVVATVVFALPAHARLSAAFEPAVHRRLVVTNWVRTVAWTSGTALGMVMLTAAI